MIRQSIWVPQRCGASVRRRLRVDSSCSGAIFLVRNRRVAWNGIRCSSFSSRSESTQSTEEAVSTATTTPLLSTSDDRSSVAATTGAYLDLAKAKLSLLVVTTTAVGFVSAGGAPILSSTFASCLVGTFLCSSSAAAWNQIFEVDRDARMKRTQQRPLVTGTLSVQQATLAASLWGAAGSTILYLGTDPITTGLGISNILLYAGLYTYLKPTSTVNTWVGAVVGAIPPVMGWTAAAAATTTWPLIDVQQPILLASLLYLWQMPHFFALSFMHRVDYKRGGFQMVPCLESDGLQTSKLVTRYTWYLSSIPLVSTALGVTSSMFALEGLVLNSYALHVAYRFRRDRTNANARKVFLTSLWYLPSLLMLYLLHNKIWDEETDQEKTKDDALQFLSNQIHSIRNKGRELCLHEAAVKKTNHDDNACPVTVASRESSKVPEAVVAAVNSTATTSTNADSSL